MPFSSLITYLIHQIWPKYWFWLFPTKFFHFEDIQTKNLISLKHLLRKAGSSLSRKFMCGCLFNFITATECYWLTCIPPLPANSSVGRLNPRFGRWLAQMRMGPSRWDWYLTWGRKDIRSLCLSFHPCLLCTHQGKRHRRTHDEMVVYKPRRASYRHRIYCHLDLELPLSRTIEINVCCLCHWIWYFVLVAWTKT